MRGKKRLTRQRDAREGEYSFFARVAKKYRKAKLASRRQGLAKIFLKKEEGWLGI